VAAGQAQCGDALEWGATSTSDKRTKSVGGGGSSGRDSFMHVKDDTTHDRRGPKTTSGPQTSPRQQLYTYQNYEDCAAYLLVGVLLI
jgi:hypothetical protein